jgi:hypothetical protein
MRFNLFVLSIGLLVAVLLRSIEGGTISKGPCRLHFLTCCKHVGLVLTPVTLQPEPGFDQRQSCSQLYSCAPTVQFSFGLSVDDNRVVVGTFALEHR